MTNIEMKKNKNEFCLIISGHAGYGEKNNLPTGCDIVCAAISAISYTMMQRVENMENEKKTISAHTECKPGYVFIHVIVKENYCDELRWTIETIKTAYELLSESYPDFVKLDLGWENRK
nr:MAG TPA: YsxB-like protein [Bacteriophage sp.]